VRWQTLLIGISSALAGSFIYDLIRQQSVKREAFKYAQSIAGKKGIINLGSGQGRSSLARLFASSPEVKVNIDITPNGVPGFRLYDLNKVPYPFKDKEFGVVFASHLIEHLDNWYEAVKEMVRIADHVVIVLPHPLSPTGLLDPLHKNPFTKGDIQWLEERFPSLKVFY